MNNNGNTKISPLHNEHARLSAKFTDFEGWKLPVQFNGIIKEHLHTRTANSVFDVCHMGEFIISGKSAASDLQRIHTCRIDSLACGRCKYGFLLNENGGIIDDTIVYKLAPDKFMLVVNAGCIDTDLKWLTDNISENTLIHNISDDTAKIDLQGPDSQETLKNLFPYIDFNILRKFSFIETEFRNTDLLISRTGYTGEDGFELYLSINHAEALWNNLLQIESVLPAGLGARDSLRLEKGYSLYGHDINSGITPVEANLERFIYFNKDFIGKEKIQEQSAAGTSKILAAFLCSGRRAARDGYEVFSDENRKIGHVTSGAYSPSLKRGIGLCFIDSNEFLKGTFIRCASGDVNIDAVIVDLPFL